MNKRIIETKFSKPETALILVELTSKGNKNFENGGNYMRLRVYFGDMVQSTAEIEL